MESESKSESRSPPEFVVPDESSFKGKVVVVTGGAGYFGARLCLDLLLHRGVKEVRCFDWSLSHAPTPLLDAAADNLTLVKGDIRHSADVDKVTRGADAVFHLASYGMSGKEMLQDKLIADVNVDGTLNVVDSCVKNGVKALVYTSTYNVVFGGQEINGGDERLGYFPVGQHVDAYARAKAVAEQVVLHANERPQVSGGTLLTCALRPAAIYGPGETRHFPRIMRNVRLGLVRFRIGDPMSKVDWIHVENLVYGHCLAMASLLLNSKEKHAAGEAFFLSDGAPMNNFEFLKPIFEAYGRAMPSVNVPVSVMLVFAWTTETVFRILMRFIPASWLLQPLILPAEVYKVGVNHYFSTERANKFFGYTPIVSSEEGIMQMQEHWSKVSQKEVPQPPGVVCLGILLGIALTAISGFVPRVHLPWILQQVQNLGLLIFFNREILQLVFWFALGIHVVEALIAAFVALKNEPENAVEWLVQTLLFGFPSLRLLLTRSLHL